MKRTRLIFLFLALCLLAASCSGHADPGTADPASESGGTTEPASESVTAPETETGPESGSGDTQETGLTESSAFRAVFPVCDETILGTLYNAPFTNGEPEPTAVWNEGEYDRLMLIPRYVGTAVRAYACSYDEEGWLNVSETPSFETVAEDGCVISASLERPEGHTSWYVAMELPDGGSAGMELKYDGRYGSPRYEFLQDPYRSSLIEVVTAMEDWNLQFDEFGYERFWGFWREAKRAGRDTWEALELCFTELTELGDGASWTATEGGDIEDGVLRLKAGRLHTAYAPEEGTLEEQLAAQNELYRKIGNEKGILGPDEEDTGEPLVFRLTGLTVYNPSLAASEVRVLVNGTDCGAYTLTEGDFFTMILLDLEDLPGDRPVEITVEILKTNYGTPGDAVIEVWPGLASNISKAV